MVRNRKRKTDREPASNEVMKTAVSQVIDNGSSIRATAKEFGINRQTLCRYVKKRRSATPGQEITFQPKYSTRRIFSDDEENALSSYTIQSSQMCYGMAPKQLRQLAYQFAVKNDKTFPETWKENCMAGEDWLYGFLKRHKNLSIRTPEATSLSRATSFNKTNVTEFFDKLSDVMNRYNFEPHNIYNLDESGVTTVQKPCKVVAQTGIKQVGQITSGERGTLVTVCGIINAIGNTVPPAFIFPRVHFKEHMLIGAPTESLGLASQSGWMNSELFLEVLKHFIRHTKCSIDHPVLLVLDNHDSHVNIPVIDLAKENGVVLLTFPPHCSHKMQPLDRTVFGPFKKYYNTSSDNWMINNPGKTMSIYDIAGLVGEAYPKAFSCENVQAGFRVSGIYPFNRNVFKDDEFLPSYVTDRDDPTTKRSDDQPIHPPTLDPHLTSHSQVSDEPVISSGRPNQGSDPNITSSQPIAGPSHQITADTRQGQLTGEPQADQHQNLDSSLGHGEHSGCTTPPFVTPDKIRPYPKAGERKTTGQGKSNRKRKGRTRILTDTPEKNEILESVANKDRRQHDKSVIVTQSKRSQKRKVVPEDESSSDSEMSVCYLSDEDEYSDNESDVDYTNIGENDYVLVKIETKKNRFYYVAVILEYYNDVDEYRVKYMKACGSKFIFPEKEDISTIQSDDIIRKLPAPLSTGGTKRSKNIYAFPCDLSTYRVYYACKLRFFLILNVKTETGHSNVAEQFFL